MSVWTYELYTVLGVHSLRDSQCTLPWWESGQFKLGCYGSAIVETVEV